MIQAISRRKSFPRRALEASRPRPDRLRDRQFWIVQILIIGVTVLLYVSHTVTAEAGFGGGLHDIPVMFYLAPVLYATVAYGFEGAVLTSVWVCVLTSPYSVLYSGDDFEWLGDLGSLTIITVTSLALAIRVERERDERERAEAASERLTLLNEVGRALGPARSIPSLLQDLVRELQRGLQLESAAAVSVVPDGRGETPVIWSNDEPYQESQAVVAGLTRVAQTGTASSPVAGWLVAPMIAGDRPLGAIAARRNGAPFSPQEREVFQTAAQQAAAVLDRLKLDLEHRSRLAAYARQVTNAQEEEQRRIARELHDGILQGLSGICRGLDLLRAELLSDDSTPDATAAALRALAEESLRDLRRLTRDLRPTILDDLGLVPGVEWLAAELKERTGIAVKFESGDTAVPLSQAQELTVFRIAQEAFRNVEKHSGATNVLASLATRSGDLEMRIVDDGCGFVVPADVNELASDGSYGLLGMRERAALNGGLLTVESNPQVGTAVTLAITPENDSTVAPLAPEHAPA